MKLTTELDGDVLRIRLDEDRLDSAVSTRFKDNVRQAMAAGGGTVLLDLGKVDFMDSSGLGALIAVLKSMPRDRRLELENLRPNVQRVFRLTRMDDVFTVRGGIGPDPARQAV